MQRNEYEWELNRKVANIWIQKGDFDNDLEVLLNIFHQNKGILGGVSIVLMLAGIFTIFWKVLPVVGF